MTPSCCCRSHEEQVRVEDRSTRRLRESLEDEMIEVIIESGLIESGLIDLELQHRAFTTPEIPRLALRRRAGGTGRDDPLC